MLGSRTTTCSFACADCGAAAAALRYLAPGTRPDVRTGGVDELFVDLPRLQLTGTVSDGIASVGWKQVRSLRRAVRRADPDALLAVDRDLAPFWCPDCADSYCPEHWERRTVGDEAGPDYVRGTCPVGHVRMLISRL